MKSAKHQFWYINRFGSHPHSFDTHLSLSLSLSRADEWHAISCSISSDTALMDHLHPGDARNTPGAGHVHARSQDTNASGIADSTISYGSLSQFPQPPASIPTTPIRSGFSTPSPSRSNFSMSTAPLVPRRRPLPGIPSSTGPSNGRLYQFPLKKDKIKASNTSALSAQSGTSKSNTSASIQTSNVSPFDWHDGASGIGIDATEDRLLSTSFITSLLQESSGDHSDSRMSYGSDAVSGFSEMTYPPQASTSEANPPPGTPLTHKLHTKQYPPSAFNPVRESPNRLSGDSETLYSSRDHGTSLLRKASVSRAVQGASVVGVAPAMLQKLSSNLTPYDEVASPMQLDGQRPLLQDEGHTGTRRFPVPNLSTPQTRDSMHSSKSAVSTLIRRLSSHPSVRRVLAWRKVKPLPPVPLIAHIPISAEIEYRRAEDMKALPDLVNRADALESYLDKGQHPHQSLSTVYAYQRRKLESSSVDGDGDYQPNPLAAVQNSHFSANSFTSRQKQTSAPTRKMLALPRNRRTRILLGICFAVCLAAVAVAIGVSVSRKKSTHPVCQGSLVGAACNLNSTCICTSSVQGQCDGLAQNLVDLLPSLQQHFSLNLTKATTYQRIWLAQDTTPGSCTSQSLLVDVAPGLTTQISEAHTHWAQTALLWNLVESQDSKATASLRNFVQKAPWKTLNPAGDTSSFSTTVSGYTFDFAKRQVQQPNLTFVDLGQPSDAQLSQVGSTARSALDRMYTFANASSTQHGKALETYWINVLRQEKDALPLFLTALGSSPILLPFDATFSRQPQSISQLLTSSKNSPFPPPLACDPGLNPHQRQQVDTIESRVFGLPPSPSQSKFDVGCFPERPIYGVLDVLRLRLPFLDLRPGIPRQAAILKRDVSPRVIVRDGEMFSMQTGRSNVTVITEEQSDPRRYGTLGRMNHVVLRYLSSMPRLEVATAVVKYVLDSASSPARPPNPQSILYESLASIPTIEVAVFGSITPTNIDSAVSSFTASDDTLFFGSEAGTALRNWVILGCGGSTAWAEAALSPLFVRDGNFSDPTFNQTWSTVSTALKNNIRNIGLVNITNTFATTNKFSEI